MITKTSLSNLSTQAKIAGALRRAIKKGYHTVTNRKGKPSFTIQYLTGDVAWEIIGKPSGFYAIELRTMRDVTEALYHSLGGVYVAK